MPYLGNVPASFNVGTNNIDNGAVTSAKLSSDLNIDLDLGSASTPSLTFDANTGIYSPGADQVAISTNGTGRLFVDASGNVGIGSATIPRGPLSIYGSTAPLIHFWNTTTTSGSGNGTSIYGFEDDFVIQNREASGVIAFQTANTERLRITSDGKVGLGTSSPQTTLHLSASNPQIRLQDSDGTDQYAQVYNSGGTTTLFSRNNTSYGPISLVQYNGTSSTTALYIDTSQRVGVGTTSPAVELEVSGTGNVQSRTRNTDTTGSASFYAMNDSGRLCGPLSYGSTKSAYGAIGTNENAFYSNGPATIAVDGANPLKFATGTTTPERMRIDSSGRLLVGTTTSRNVGSGTNGLFQIEQISAAISQSIVCNNNSATGGILSLGKSRGTTAGSFTIVQDGDELGSIRFAGADGTDLETQAAKIDCFVDGTPGANDMPGRLVFSTTADGAGSPTERMRICSTSSNDDILYLNCTGRTNVAPNTTGGRIWQTNGNCKVRTADNIPAFQFYSASGGTSSAVGTIVVNASSTSYNTSSDYRLKENVVDLDGAITRVKQLAPKRFNFITDADTTVDGFLAHEAQAVVPEAVTGTHNEVDDDGNAVMQGIDQSKLVPLLTAALQEAIVKIETLEAKVAALESA